MITQRRSLFATVIAAALLAACAQPQVTTGPVRQVTGTVDYQDRTPLPAPSVLVVELQDTSRADTPSQVVSQQAIKLEGLQPPFKFTLPVEASKINPSTSYVVRARITSGKDAILVSDTVQPVLTRGGGQTADLMLVRVAPN